MKKYIAFIFTSLFLASIGLAQEQNQNQQLPQVDTTSGWKVVFSNPNYTFGELMFPSQDSGFVLASDGTKLILYRSTDRGISWDSVGLPPIGRFCFTTTLVGYCSGGPNSKTVWKTTDGGRSWIAHARNSVSSGPIVFANKDTGIVFSSTTMARTTDAGETWKEIIPAYGVNLEAGSFGSSQVGYSVGDTYMPHPDSPEVGFCEKTTDEGVTWTPINTGIPGYFYSCIALDEKIVIIGTDHGVVGKTYDGGKTWDSTRLSPGYPNFWSISFASKSHGLIVGSGGLIFATTDTGRSWKKQYFQSGITLMSAAMVNDSVALVCGSGNIWRTMVGGNFSSVTNHSYNFQLQAFPNPALSSITTQYQLPFEVSVLLRVYDAQGILVRNLPEGIQNIGIHQTSIDLTSLPNGAYYLNLSAGQNSQTVSFTIQK